MDEALKWIQKGIEHTPTMIDLYTLKAKIMQFAGNIPQARKLTNEARMLDLADRYLNAYSSKYMLKNNEVDKAHETMAIFSREDENGKINVHENQTMWFENHNGLAHYRLGNYRLALKNFQYIEQHLEQMLDDSYDFHHYSFRKVTINHYLQMLDFLDTIFTGKYPIKACTNILQTLSKIDKKYNGNAEEVKKEFEEYKQTEEYQKWKKDFETKEEEDAIRNDPDPQGWDSLIKAITSSVDMAVSIASKVAPHNPENIPVQAKSLRWFIKGDKFDKALECATKILKHNPSHPKAYRAVSKFIDYANKASLDDTQKQSFENFNKKFKPVYEANKLTE